MTILTINVYSPLAGTRVCPTPHLTCPGGYDPVDVMGSGSLYFRATNVKSFSVYRYLCGDPSCSTDIRTLMQINLFGRINQECFIGAVRYLHIQNPSFSNGHSQNYNGESILIGRVPSGACVNYNGLHSHMERFRGSLVAPNCNAPIALTTPIFRFVWDDTICQSISSVDFTHDNSSV